MTNAEALISLCGFSPDKNAVERVLIEKNLNSGGTFNPLTDLTLKSSLNLCAIDLLGLLLSTPDQVNENGFKITFDRKAVEDGIKTLKITEGLLSEPGKPIIRAVSRW